ncbi:MAG: hypothetical protein K6A67_03190 [Bacteroidales bacterium]|nr:hypothetical protein [Bacteroidales bacterium]
MGAGYNPTAVMLVVTAHRGTGRESAVASVRSGAWCGGRSLWLGGHVVRTAPQQDCHTG